MMHRRLIKTAQELPQRSLKMFSYNMFGTEEYRRLITFVVTFSLVVSYCFMSFFIVKQIAREDASGIRDLLAVHGLPFYMHWVMLFLHALLFRIITSIFVFLCLTIDLGNGSVRRIHFDRISSSDSWGIFKYLFIIFRLSSIAALLYYIILSLSTKWALHLWTFWLPFMCGVVCQNT